MAFSISACALFGGDTVQEGETSVSVEDISTGEDSSIEIKTGSSDESEENIDDKTEQEENLYAESSDDIDEIIETDREVPESLETGEVTVAVNSDDGSLHSEQGSVTGNNPSEESNSGVTGSGNASMTDSGNDSQSDLDTEIHPSGADNVNLYNGDGGIMLPEVP